MRSDNLNMLYDTLRILDQGYYTVDGKRVPLKLNREDMRNIRVFLPEDVKRIEESRELDLVHNTTDGICISCTNEDSFSCALRIVESQKKRTVDPVAPLVLNFANPVHPGGGVRRGATAQEEDLCRKSSLLLSLESQAAAPYYRYNDSLHTMMASDAMMITPKVEILKDVHGKLLPESAVVSVMTCAAPMIRYGLEGYSEEEYETLFYNRIVRMLKAAAYLGYRVLVLGAFGCGAFRNDAKLVSDLFCRALKEFDFDGRKAKDCFSKIDFAVLDHSPDLYNFHEFSRDFGDSHHEEDKA